MKNKVVLKGCFIGFAVVLLSLFAMYLVLSGYYMDGFSYGTFINGVYCTGRSINEINEELLRKCNYKGLTIIMDDGRSYTISAEEVGLSFSYIEALELYQKKQNPYLWIDNLISSKRDNSILPSIQYDEQIFENKLISFGITEGKSNTEREIKIQKGDNGYYLINERENVFDAGLAKRVIYDAFEDLQPVIDLKDKGCYSDLPLTSDMQDTLKMWKKISEYQDCRIVYQFGDEKVPVNMGDACDFLLLDTAGGFVLDEEGRLCTDEEKVYAFVDALADKYDTVGITRLFHATRGDVVSVQGGIYGNQIDRDAEKEYLLNAFIDKKNEIHTPKYLQTAQKQGLDDIGDTYIEVDMTEQMLYYYVKNELVIETPVVTGNITLKRGTPCGTNYVYSKQRNRTLRGQGYASFVKYWLPVNGNIGIHDSSWRKDYGGEIYIKNGSHGCINIPDTEASKLYDMVEIGTPCVMFY